MLIAFLVTLGVFSYRACSDLFPKDDTRHRQNVNVLQLPGATPEGRSGGPGVLCPGRRRDSSVSGNRRTK